MNLMISSEHYISEQEQSAAMAKRQAVVKAIEKDCAAFNDVKKKLFDHLSATVEAINSDSKHDICVKSEETLCAILFAKDSLNALFATVLQTHTEDC